MVYSNLTLTASRPGDVIEVTCEVSSEAFVQLLRKEVKIKVRPRQTPIPNSSTTMSTSTSTKPMTTTLSTTQPSAVSPHYSSPVKDEIVINLLEGDQQLRSGWQDDKIGEAEKVSRSHISADERVKLEWATGDHFAKESREEKQVALSASGQMDQLETSGLEYDYSHLDYINQRMNNSFPDMPGYEYAEQVIRDF
jgi:hypothetical protein